LGPEKSGRLKKGPNKSDEPNWPLLTGGRCSEVVVKTGLTVYEQTNDLL
jgi:hypothetical protein